MNRIKEIRSARNMTQSDLAKIMNCTKMTISRYESGDREIDSYTINRLCEIFQITADYLLCRSNTPEPSVSEEDARLLRAYREAPDHIRIAILAMLQLDGESPAAHEARAAG